jgi:hypothetical protein
MTMKITEFLLARILEDEVRATPKTICVSGGPPAPEVPNCIGPDGRGCSDHWRLEPPVDASQRWWNTPKIEAQMRAHEMTHITPSQHRGLAECAAKRAIIGVYRLYTAYSELTDRDPGVRTQMCDHAMTLGEVLPPLAAVYKDHPDYRPEWEL